MNDLATKGTAPRLVPFSDLKERWGLNVSKRHLRRLFTAGKFPRPVKLTGGPTCRLMFPEAEVEASLNHLLAARGK